MVIYSLVLLVVYSSSNLDGGHTDDYRMNQLGFYKTLAACEAAGRRMKGLVWFTDTIDVRASLPKITDFKCDEVTVSE